MELEWADTEHLLSTLIDNLNKKRFETEDFDEKYLRLIQWFENFLNRELNQRLDGLTIETRLEVLKTDVPIVIRDKQKLIEELIAQVRVLQSKLTDSIRIENCQNKIEQLQTIIRSLDEHLQKKSII